jgi:hypothetical protein
MVILPKAKILLLRNNYIIYYYYYYYCRIWNQTKLQKGHCIDVILPVT